jgi:hypothetical protein
MYSPGSRPGFCFFDETKCATIQINVEGVLIVAQHVLVTFLKKRGIGISLKLLATLYYLAA